MRFLIAMCVSLAGCGGTASGGANSGNVDGDDGGPSGPDTDEPPNGDLGLPVAWELSGVLHVMQTGVLSQDDNALAVRLLDGQRNVLCEADLIIDAVATHQAEQFPDEALLSWWGIYSSLPTEPRCFVDEYPFPVPNGMMLGIGLMDPNIRAAAGSDPELTELDSLNAAYVSLDMGETVWVFGVVGTAEAYSGEDGALSELPVPAGDWMVEPLYPFPF